MGGHFAHEVSSSGGSGWVDQKVNQQLERHRAGVFPGLGLYVLFHTMGRRWLDQVLRKAQLSVAVSELAVQGRRGM